MVVRGDDYRRVICSMEPNSGNSGRDSVSCSVIVRVAAYDTVRVQFFQGTDNTPLYTDGNVNPLYEPARINGFSGFRI